MDGVPRVTLFCDPVFETHETGEHPERAERLRAIHAELQQRRLIDRCAAGEVRAATAEELERVHPAAYIDSLRTFAASGGGRIEVDTEICHASCDVAVQAAGAACAAVDAVLSGSARSGPARSGPVSRALSLSRPPGHHALADAAMGFCLFNNAAVAAQQARLAHGLERVLIVDWDVHHGNGTQDIFYEDGQVHFFSSHRWPFYPGSGHAVETGAGRGLGATHNLPLTFGISRQEFLDRFRAALEKCAERCKPELVILSAGFDAHALDPVGSLGLESEDFGDLTRYVLDVAQVHAGGRIVSLLEGGYHLGALAESVACHLETMLETPG